MTGMTTRYSDATISVGTAVYFERQALKKTVPILILEKFGLAKTMPKNKGQVIAFRRPRLFTAATTPLTEGITPSATQFSYDRVQGTLKQYGMVVEITDWIEDLSSDPVLNEAADEVGNNLARTMEAIAFGAVKAGTNVIYANGTARNAVNTPITLNLLRNAVRTLRSQKAVEITKILDGSSNFQTSPVEAAFIGIGHTDLEHDIRNLAGFKPVAEYGQRRMIHERELGTVENIRVVLSPDYPPFADAGGAKAGANGTMVSTSGTSADVYPFIIFGEEAFGIVTLRGQGAMEPTIIPVGTKTKDDPLGQRGYIGWKSWALSLILNDNWMVRIETGATLLT